MAVTVIDRPQGFVLGSEKNGSISSSYGTTDATIYTVAPHGLSETQVIYIESDVENYNGFVFVFVTGTNTFKIGRHGDGLTYIPYIQPASIVYYTIDFEHGWNAVHLPIIYRMASDIYPINSSDPIRSISSTANANGYTVLNLSGSLGTINSYDYLYLTTPNDDITDVYQIVEWINDMAVIINLAYDSSHNFATATAQKYYSNYNILVRIYVGINSSHEYASQRPYQLISTIQLIPDSTGQVFFSVNEFVKGLIETRNNPLIGTYPNNIDFWNNFYIEYAESYDDSDGYSLGTFTSPFTSDQSNFEGTGMNAKLEFKNLHSGSMSDYTLFTSTSKLLTNFSNPVLFSGIYQDVSFIAPRPGTYKVTKQFYLNGAAGLLQTTDYITDGGVIRALVEANCSYDSVAISVSFETEPVIYTLDTQTGSLIITGYDPTITIGLP